MRNSERSDAATASACAVGVTMRTPRAADELGSPAASARAAFAGESKRV